MSNIIQAFPKGGNSGSSVPIGGTEGQVLKKLSNTDGDAGWADDDTAEELTAEEIEEIKAAFNPTVEPIDLSSITVEGQTIQMDEMPLASAAEIGKVYQFIGTTNADYKKGHFYECKESSGSYIWDELPQGPDLTEGDGIDIDEDGTISVEELTAEEVQDIKDGFLATNTSPVATVYTKYSTNETIVGEWIDGKPIYQKTIEIDTTDMNANTETKKDINHGIFNINKVIKFGGTWFLKSNASGGIIPYRTGTYSIDGFADASKLSIYYKDNWTITKLYITIQYTKTTN